MVNCTHTEGYKFYIYSYEHRNSSLKKSNEIQEYAAIYLLLNYSTCFKRPSRPSSGVHQIVDRIRAGVGPSVPHQPLFGHV